MFVTSDSQERVLVEDAIIDARKLRAEFMAETFVIMVCTVKAAFVTLKNMVQGNHRPTGLNPTA